MLSEEFLNGEFNYVNLEFLRESGLHLSTSAPAKFNDLSPWARDLDEIGVLYPH